ncbi:MAG: EamA family transporter [Betaproteobacteria bacterium]
MTGAHPTRSAGHDPLVLSCLAATWLVWGSTYLAIKFALVSLPPFFQMGTRFLVAGSLLLAWMRVARKAPWPSPRQWRNALWIGTLLLGGGMGFTAYAEQSIESGLVVAFIGVGPILQAAFNSLWKIYPSRLEAAGIAVGMVGVLMLTQGAGFRGSPVGLVAMILATTTWAAGSVLSQRRFELAPGAMGFASEMLCGGIVLMAMSVAAGESSTVVANWPYQTEAVLAWLYLVVFGSLIAFNAYMVLLARASAGVATSYTFVNPVIAMLLGIWLAGEVVTAYEWKAVAVILVGVMLLMARRWR